MRHKNHNKARTQHIPYAATVTVSPGSGEVTAVIGQLEGAVTVNIVDPFAESGDKLVILFESDATPRTITLGGAQGAAGSIALAANSVAAVSLVYSALSGKYISPVIPT